MNLNLKEKHRGFSERYSKVMIRLFSDLTKKVTLQNLFHDGGFSNMGVSQAVMDYFEEK